MTHEDKQTTSSGNDSESNRNHSTTESDHSPPSRRQVLKGGSASLAVSPFVLSGVAGSVGSALGLNSKGAPVVVLQRALDDPIGPNRREALIERLYDDATDRGRDVPNQMSMAELGTSGGETTDQSSHEGSGADRVTLDREPEVVTTVKTITDDGSPRGYLGVAGTNNSAGLAHATGMSRAKKFAETNGSVIELHKPNGKQKTLTPSEVGKADRPADLPGQTLTAGLGGSEYALRGERYAKFANQLESSLTSMATSVDYDIEMDAIDRDELDYQYDPYGRDVYEYAALYADTGADNGSDVDLYGVENQYDMIPGTVGTWGDDDWYNDLGKVRHYWNATDLGSTSLADRNPKGDSYSGSSTDTQSGSISVGWQTLSASYGWSHSIATPNYVLKDKTDKTVERAGWNMVLNGGAAEDSTAVFSNASMAWQDTHPHDCNWHVMADVHKTPKWRRADGEYILEDEVWIVHKIKTC